MLNWPPSLPQAFIADSYSEAMPDNLIRDQFDTGPAGVRRRSTAGTYEVTGSMLMTTAQWEAFRAFCVSTILDRSLPFTFPQQACPQSPLGRDMVELDRTEGSAFGDATAFGGLAAAFDGVTTQAAAACAGKAATTFLHIGRSFAKPKIISQAIVHGSSDQGFVNSINPTLAAYIYAKNGAPPANFGDGTQIGAGIIVDTANESAGRTSSLYTPYSGIPYDHAWVAVLYTGAANNMMVAEVRFFTYALLVRITAPPTRSRHGAGKWLVNLKLEVLP